MFVAKTPLPPGPGTALIVLGIIIITFGRKK